MYNKRLYLVTKIRFYTRIRKYITLICLLLVAFCAISFLFFGYYGSSGAIKLIAQYKNRNNLKIEKIMINPTIKFDYDGKNYYDIKAKEAIHQGDDDILLYGVSVDGAAINIKSDKLLITNNGDDLTFSGNPVLIIKQTPKNL